MSVYINIYIYVPYENNKHITIVLKVESQRYISNIK